MSGVGTLNEKSLHAQLKEWCAQPGDQFEVPLDGYIIDIVRGERLIEVQTRNFSAMKTKLDRLTRDHHVTLVYPIALTKWLTKPELAPPTRRRSPKKGHILNVFSELVSFPHLVARANFSIEIVLIEEEESRVFDETRIRRRRKGWVTSERRLLRVVETLKLDSIDDFANLLPDLPDRFTTVTIAEGAAVGRRVAQQAAYCLRKMDAIHIDGKDANTLIYRRTDRRAP